MNTYPPSGRRRIACPKVHEDVHSFSCSSSTIFPSTWLGSQLPQPLFLLPVCSHCAVTFPNPSLYPLRWNSSLNQPSATVSFPWSPPFHLDGRKLQPLLSRCLVAAVWWHFRIGDWCELECCNEGRSSVESRDYRYGCRLRSPCTFSKVIDLIVKLTSRLYPQYREWNLILFNINYKSGKILESDSLWTVMIKAFQLTG